MFVVVAVNKYSHTVHSFIVAAGLPVTTRKTASDKRFCPLSETSKNRGLSSRRLIRISDNGPNVVWVRATRWFIETKTLCNTQKQQRHSSMNCCYKGFLTILDYESGVVREASNNSLVFKILVHKCIIQWFWNSGCSLFIVYYNWFIN